MARRKSKTVTYPRRWESIEPFGFEEGLRDAVLTWEQTDALAEQRCVSAVRAHICRCVGHVCFCGCAPIAPTDDVEIIHDPTTWWADEWRERPFRERWSACRAYMDATGKTMAEFLAEEPYVKCWWVR